MLENNNMNTINTINEWSPYPKNKDYRKKVERAKIVPSPNPYDDKKGWSKKTDKAKDGDWYKNESMNLSSRYLHKIITESIQKLIFEEGDYVSSGYADKDGEIYRNPKNGHVKRVKIGSKYETKPNKVGDYVSSGYADKYGRIFRNPKNGHVKRIREGYYDFDDDFNADDVECPYCGSNNVEAISAIDTHYRCLDCDEEFYLDSGWEPDWDAMRHE